ncbi:hypothetical protein Agabi119p4_10594 [Agaricus bisporus var. burnettii]|uniref:Uncharacterized protein n=1 Tax=Agaricus bisporus var. burnettii TaxID=192524 RepID=A0A8H7EX38_AGABI|nr:hypothetical protein Agabi119p4_10594 [Agaricus bisporus var. burnettii]
MHAVAISTILQLHCVDNSCRHVESELTIQTWLTLVSRCTVSPNYDFDPFICPETERKAEATSEKVAIVSSDSLIVRSLEATVRSLLTICREHFLGISRRRPVKG